MNWKAKYFRRNSMQQQVATRQSVRGRWSLSENSVNKNSGFEMQETREHGSDTDTLQKKYNDHNESLLDVEDKNKKYINVQKDMEMYGENRLNSIGHRINDQVTLNLRLESTNSKYTDNVKSISTENELEIQETRMDSKDNKHVDDEIIRKPLTKSNSKVWKREVDKQPEWQKFVLEFTKKLSEVDEDSKKTEDTTLSGKDILKSVSQKRKNVNVVKEVVGVAHVTVPTKEEVTKSNQGVKKRNINQDTSIHKNQSNAKIVRDVEKTEQTSLEGSRYSGRLSLDIFKAITPKVIEMDAKNDTTRQKLYIGRFVKWFLDINAIILICVFVFLSILFH